LSCKGKADFIDYLYKKGYKVKYTDSHITVTKPGVKKGVRVDTLAKQFGDKYKKANLEKSMGIHSTAVSKKEKPVPPCQKEETPYVNEWQRYENWHFSRPEYKNIKPPSIASLVNTNNAGIFALRLAFYIMLQQAVVNQRLTPPLYQKKYKVQRLSKPLKNYPVKTAGNIPYKQLIGADGINFTVKITPEQLTKVTTAPFFYSSRVNPNNSTVTITIK